MTEEFKRDIEAMCQKYGGLAGILEHLADLERDTANGMLALGNAFKGKERAKHYNKMADKLLDARDYWVSF